MEQFDAYSHALVSMAVFALIGLILGPVSGAKKAADGGVAGAMPAPNYDSAAYRLSRAHLNTVEIGGFFFAVTVAAILTGGNAFWVNMLASLFLVSRIAVAYIHIRGFGGADRGLRSYVFIVGWLCCIGLGVIAVFAAF